MVMNCILTRFNDWMGKNLNKIGQAVSQVSITQRHTSREQALS